MSEIPISSPIRPAVLLVQLIRQARMMKMMARLFFSHALRRCRYKQYCQHAELKQLNLYLTTIRLYLLIDKSWRICELLRNAACSHRAMMRLFGVPEVTHMQSPNLLSELHDEELSEHGETCVIAS
eukprot:6181922-Pleurochrysis_carterae.AAC.1